MLFNTLQAFEVVWRKSCDWNCWVKVKQVKYQTQRETKRNKKWGNFIWNVIETAIGQKREKYLSSLDKWKLFIVFRYATTSKKMCKSRIRSFRMLKVRELKNFIAPRWSTISFCDELCWKRYFNFPRDELSVSNRRWWSFTIIHNICDRNRFNFNKRQFSIIRTSQSIQPYTLKHLHDTSQTTAIIIHSYPINFLNKLGVQCSVKLS